MVKTGNPDAALIIAGNFNQTNLKKVMPDFHQFDKSNHAAILLRSKCINKHAPPLMCEVKKWSHQSEANLKSALHDAAWSRTSPFTNDINGFILSVMDLACTITEATAPKAAIKSFHTRNHGLPEPSCRLQLRAGNMASYHSGSLQCKKRSKGLREESGTTIPGGRSLKHMVKFKDYNKPFAPLSSADASLASKLNKLCARLGVIGSQQAKTAEAEVNGWVSAPSTPIILSDQNVRRAFKRVNTKKAAGPDSISGQVLKLYADQLVPVFTMIIKMSLAHFVIPTCRPPSLLCPRKQNQPA